MRGQRKKRKKTKRIYGRTNRRSRRQLDGFLNHYDFPYAGRGMINEVAKVAPSVIKVAINDINNIATDRKNQIISQDGKKVERVPPKMLRGAIKDVYKMPKFEAKLFNEFVFIPNIKPLMTSLFHLFIHPIKMNTYGIFKQTYLTYSI